MHLLCQVKISVYTQYTWYSAYYRGSVIKYTQTQRKTKTTMTGLRSGHGRRKREGESTIDSGRETGPGRRRPLGCRRLLSLRVGLKGITVELREKEGTIATGRKSVGKGRGDGHWRETSWGRVFSRPGRRYRWLVLDRDTPIIPFAVCDLCFVVTRSRVLYHLPEKIIDTICVRDEHQVG